MAPPPRPTQLPWREFALTAIQLALLLVAMRALELERSFGLLDIGPVVFLGFCLHPWLPGRWKLPAFLATSFAAFVVVLGWTNAGLLVALGLGVLAIAHLPIAFGARVASLLVLALGLSLLRADPSAPAWTRVVLPVLGAMFMFRLVVYLYDERTGHPPVSPWMRLSYFFLLPNVCFLLFPVVDYRTFCRTWKPDADHATHQRGIQWILRGVVHLVLYRFVYDLAPPTSAINDLAGVGLFVVTSYLLYLRISGHFHIAIGLLHLFGFRLPETNHRYLLASSFTDCWRRINVYWTEFMKKVVYWPTFVALKRRGTTLAMMGATALVFLATWVLHAFQWFWLQGSFPLAVDGLFWALAGVLALATAWWELTRAKPKALARGAPGWSDAWWRSVRTLGVFLFISLVWSLWCVPTPGHWLDVMSRAGNTDVGQVLALAGGAALVLCVGTVAQRWTTLPWAAVSDVGARGRVAFRTVGCVLVAALGAEPLQRAAGEQWVAALRPLVQEGLNVRDEERLMAGYYDRLVDREGFGGRAWERRRAAPAETDPFFASAIGRRTDEPWLVEFVPSARDVYYGALVTTNSHGMRDREYERDKPPDTFRILLLGTCFEMGLGVGDDDVWEALVEERLGREAASATALRYEILNFSMPSFGTLQQAEILRARGAAFRPDVVVLSNHLGSNVNYLMEAVAREGPWPPLASRLLGEAGAVRGMTLEEMRPLVGRVRDAADLLGVSEIAEIARGIGAIPVLAEFPLIDFPSERHRSEAEARAASLRHVARGLGYEILDASNAFHGHDVATVTLPEFTHCPNTTGQRLLADRFFDALVAHGRLLAP